MRIDRLALVLISAAIAGGACSDPANDVPIAAIDDAAATDEDTAIVIDVLANDLARDGAALTLVAARAPGHEVAIDGGKLRVTPARDFHGSIDVAYTVTDGETSVDGHAIVTVRAVDDAPVARAATITAGRNAVTAIALAGEDVDGDALTYEIVTPPAHGELAGAEGARRYAPAHDYVGADRLAFRVVAKGVASAPAEIAITVVAGQAPVAVSATLTTMEDRAGALALGATDADGDPLTYTVTAAPSHGTLTGTAPNLTYTPAADFNGADTITFTATDGVLTSAPAVVAITVTPVNDAPLLSAQTIAATEDLPKTITLAGTDVDGDTLSYAIASDPAHASLLGNGATRVYLPAANYNGADAFTVTVSDGQATSAPATIAIAVAPVDDVPTADTGAVAVTEDVAAAFTLTGHDPDGDALTFAITAAPAHGQLVGTPPQLTYLPDADFAGVDTLQFTAHDGQHPSVPATVTLQVAPVNDPPTTGASSITTPEDQAIAIVLTGSDPDGDPLTFAITGAPAHGTILSGTTSVIYTPAHDFHGADAFAYTVSDGTATTAGTAAITVTSVNDAPVARDDLAEGAVGAPQTVRVIDNDTDPDGDVVTLDVVTAPSAGSVDIIDDTLVYQPLPGFTGTDVVTYTVVDGAGGSATATLRLGVGQFPAGAPVGLVGPTGESVGALTGRNHAISDDGRFIAFASSVATLVADDTNGKSDVFVYDRLEDTLERVSVAGSGAQGAGGAASPSISADGRYVAFASTSANLVAGDTNGLTDIFVRDRVAHTTVRVSVAADGAQANNTSFGPSISDDGQRVAFGSWAFNLVASDANGATDVFVRDLVAGTTVRASVATSGAEADLASTGAALSGDGKVVVFASKATNLVAGDTNAVDDVFVRDLATGVTERVSVASTGGESDGASRLPSLSRDGRFIAFESTATTLVVGTTTALARIYVRDRQGITTTLSFGSATDLHAPDLSSDGRYLVAHAQSGAVMLRDRFAGLSSTLATGGAYVTILSGNGRYAATLASASLVPGTPTTGTQVFVTPNPR